MTRLPLRRPGAARARPAARCAVAAGAAILAAACGSTQGGQPPAAPPSSPVPARTGPAATGSGPARAAAAGLYLAIARPANRRLDHDFDGFQDNSRDNLAGAEADLRDAAATERRFDRQLLALSLPSAEMAIARVMVTANQSRASLTDAAARSTSLAALDRYKSRLTAANVPVEDAVRVIRDQLGLPPPQTS